MRTENSQSYGGTQPGTRPRNAIMIVAKENVGHHAEYVQFFQNIFRNAGRDNFTESNISRALLHPGPVIITMMEEYPWSWFVVGLFRAMMFRRTVALFFRVREVLLATGLVLVGKRTLLRAVRHQSRMAIFTIIPHSVIESAIPDKKCHIGKLSHDWIDDPQMWDLDYFPKRPSSTALSDRAVLAAKKRLILMVVGVLSPVKGLRQVCELTQDRTFNERVAIVIAGKTYGADEKLIKKMTSVSALFEDRYISQDELNSLYAVSDLVWCAYSPVFDQSSGIFGRAMQLGVTPIVRKGSIVEAYARECGLPVLAIDFEDPDPSRSIVPALASLPNPNIDPRSKMEQANRNIGKLIGALFGKPAATLPGTATDAMVPE